jgi:hypothetical protein
MGTAAESASSYAFHASAVWWVPPVAIALYFLSAPPLAHRMRVSHLGSEEDWIEVPHCYSVPVPRWIKRYYLPYDWAMRHTPLKPPLETYAQQWLELGLGDPAKSPTHF